MMRQLTQMLRRAPVVSHSSLTTPILARYFASYDRFSQGQGHEQDDRRSQQSRYEQRDSGYNREAQPPRTFESEPFNVNAFQQFTQSKGRDLSAYISKESESQGSPEIFLTKFGSSLRNKEAFFAWKDLSPEFRLNFIDNIFALQLEAQNNRKRINTFNIIQFFFDKSIKSADEVSILHALNTVKATNNNTQFVQQVVNAFFTEVDRSRNAINPSKIRTAFILAEQMLLEIIQNSKSEMNPNVMRRNHLAIASYLSSATNYGFGSERNANSAIKNHFVNLDLQNALPGATCLGYAAIASGYKFSQTVTVTNQNVIDSLNEILSFFNTGEKPSDSNYDNSDFASDEAQSSQGFNRDNVCPEVTSGRWLSIMQINTITQAIFLSENGNVKPFKNILALMTDNLSPRNVNLQFRRWLTNYARNQDLSKMPLDLLITLARSFSRFVNAKRFTSAFLTVFKAIAARADQIKYNRDWSHILVAITPLRNQIVNESNDPEAGTSAFAYTFTDEDKTAINDLHAHALEQVTKPENVFSFDDNLQLIHHLVTLQKVWTSEKLKAHSIHRITWEQLDKKKFLSSELNKVFSALASYDLLKDEDMQKILLVAIEKSEAKFNDKFPDKELINRSSISLTKIQEMFDSQEGGHSGQAKKVHEKLQSYKEKENKRG